jgi:hypothetical protein
MDTKSWRERKQCSQAKETGYINMLTCYAASKTYSWQDLQDMELQATPTDSITDTGKAFIPSGGMAGGGGSSVWSESAYCTDSGTGKKGELQKINKNSYSGSIQNFYNFYTQYQSLTFGSMLL